MNVRNIVVFLLLKIVAANVKFDNHQVLRILPRNINEVSLLRDLENLNNFDFWKSATAPDRFVDVRLTPNDVGYVEKILTANNIPYNIMISNVQELVANQYNHQPRGQRALEDIESFDYSTYHNLEEIEEWGDVLVAQFSDYAQKFQIGVSYEGRPLNTIEIRKPSSDGNEKKTLYIDSLIHAREWVVGGASMFTIKEILTNPTLAWMVDEFDWIYVPVVNVDGYKYNEIDRMWRKTRSSGPSTECTGADPNRNFDSHWSEPGASGNPCSEIYYGPTVVSENVVRHLSKYIYERRDKIEAVISIHSYSQMILFPYGWSEDPAPEFDELNELGNKMHDAMEAVHGMEYVNGQSSTTIYVTTGDTTDWAYDIGIYKTYTFELRDEGEYGFLLPENQIIPSGEEFLAAMVALAEYHRTD